MPRRCNWASQCTDYFFGLTVKKRRIGVVDVNDNIINKNKVTLISLIIPTANKRYFIKYFTMYMEKSVSGLKWSKVGRRDQRIMA